MSSQTAPATHDLSKYAELLLELERQGLSYVVVGELIVRSDMAERSELTSLLKNSTS